MRECRHVIGGAISRKWCGLGSVLFLALAITVGCGLGEDVAGQCQLEREGLEAASRYQEGLIQRNVDKQSAAYRESVERVRAAGAKLQQCKEDAASD